MKLVSIERIHTVTTHPNADALDIVGILGYKAIVKRNQYSDGDLVVFIQPDTVLPDAPWATFYKSKSSRVKAVKLRGSWSMGIVESIENVFGGPEVTKQFIPSEGLDVTMLSGVTKYEPPVPADLSAKGLLPFGIPKTDEERYQSLTEEELHLGEVVDVTLKVDGQSLTAYCKILEDGSVVTGVTGRTLEFKDDAINNYTRNVAKRNVLEKLKEFCLKHNVSLALRGESYGTGVQSFKLNPHAKVSNDIAFFSVYNITEHRYERKGSPLYFRNICAELDLPTVRILESDVVLTRELLLKYDEGIENIDGTPFEGAVINHSEGSFKVINKFYDSNK